MIFIIIFTLGRFMIYKSDLIFIKELLLLLIAIFISFLIPNILGKKIGGFNGDLCGASVVIVETVMLFIYAIFL